MATISRSLRTFWPSSLFHNFRPNSDSKHSSLSNHLLHHLRPLFNDFLVRFLFSGSNFRACDYYRWIVEMDKPGGDKQEIIHCYVQTLTKVIGSEEEAKQKIYDFSCEGYFWFGCETDKETSDKLRDAHGVRLVVQDKTVEKRIAISLFLKLGKFLKYCPNEKGKQCISVLDADQWLCQNPDLVWKFIIAARRQTLWIVDTDTYLCQDLQLAFPRAKFGKHIVFVNVSFHDDTGDFGIASVCLDDKFQLVHYRAETISCKGVHIAELRAMALACDHARQEGITEFLLVSDKQRCINWIIGKGSSNVTKVDGELKEELVNYIQGSLLNLNANVHFIHHRFNEIALDVARLAYHRSDMTEAIIKIIEQVKRLEPWICYSGLGPNISKAIKVKDNIGFAADDEGI